MMKKWLEAMATELLAVAEGPQDAQGFDKLQRTAIKVAGQLQGMAAVLPEGVSVAAADAATRPVQTHKESGFGQFVTHRDAINAAREEMRRDRAALERVVETTEPEAVLCKGGPADGTCVPVPQDMPVGARTLVDGCVYEMQEDRTLAVKVTMPSKED